MASYPLHALFHVEKESSSSKPGPEPVLDRPDSETLDPAAAGQNAALPVAEHGDPEERGMNGPTSKSERRKSASTKPVEVPIAKPAPTQQRIHRAVVPAEISHDIAPFLEHEPPTPPELEASRPTTPTSTHKVDVTQSWRNPTINKWRFISVSLVAIGNGMNDSAPGALLPSMEEHYSIGYAVVSLIFISNAIGFISAAFFVHALDSRLGRARSLIFADTACLAAAFMQGFAPPFPALVVGYFIAGFGQATNLALNNVWVANLANATILLGWFHGAYGLGGLVAPLIATSIINHGILFSRFYFIMVGLRALTIVAGGFTFWNYERDNPSTTSIPLTSPNGTTNPIQSKPSKITQLTISLRNRTTLTGAAFIFAYQGAEVSISGWAITFLIAYRSGDPANVGYVTSGFWGGITLGRLLLSYPAHRVGEKLFCYLLMIGSIGFQFLVWFLPNVIGDAVGIAILGLLLGPVYPCATTVFSRLLPRQVQNTSLAFVSGAGSSGGAVAPFVTGLVAQGSGTWVLHPICVSLFVAMGACWFGLPKLAKRRE